MIIDARQIDQFAGVSGDICIVGAGAAGISMALEFERTKVEVVLLEGGGIDPDPETQSLYAGENVGLSHEPPDESRSRYLGGSTNCWGGWCRPLDAMDFEERPWIDNSGWPISKHDLLPYYERSHSLLELGDFNYNIGHWSSEIAKKNAALFPLDGNYLYNAINQLSSPTHFGAVYRPRLNQASNVKLFLFANAAEILTDETGTQVTGVRVATLNHKTFNVSAKVVVLAAGGIENPRLLLLSDKVQTAGLGNGRDQVGRYYMDHPRIQAGRISITEAKRYRPLYDATLINNPRGRGPNKRTLAAHLAPTPELQQRMKLPNSRTYLVARNLSDLSSSYFALKAVRRAFYGRRHFRHPLSRVAREILRQLPILTAHAPRTVMTIAEVLLNPILMRRHFYLETVIEPIPNPESRVTLCAERDQLGLSQVRINWQLTEKDRDHFVTINKLVLATLSQTGIALPAGESIEYAQYWPRKIVGCWHHMGTTRMHDDPAKGVVDAECRVHGINNLFIAGSSVFPTVGSDSPTITLVALALRLCDQIRPGFQ
ncbi:MAG: GMC family oxidoreductase [Beijerinckiaceae bacterium]|nr:GMC family oxidoreductase [Beijerinckiaceae bacterium]MCI0736940.1 GMC family oxidoreductase [Beijerinckiaceae bacterium]